MESNLARVDRVIANIYQMMQRPAFAEETSEQMKLRADRRRDTATNIKLRGGHVKPEYE